jgi:hypothetical protein
VCGGLCVDVTKDKANCGACGSACSATQTCSNSACSCGPGQSACGSACVNLSDNSLNCGACGSACGANQVCTAGACANLVPGNGKAGGGLSGLNPPKVAVYGAASSTDLQTKLAATGGFTQVDFVNVNSTTPTLAQMKAYDAVVVYTYLSVTQAFGDNLADYFEAGGGVVLCDYESQETGTYVLKGRFQTDYAMSTPIGSAGFSNVKVTLGNILEPGSLLLTGVTTFGIQGSSPLHLPSAQFNKNNPIVVALFSDGTPAIVRGTVTNAVVTARNLVEINSFGLSSAGNSTYGWDPTTDGAKLFRNALYFTMTPPAVTVATSIALGNQPLFTPSAPQTVTYTNTSSVAQTITALSISGSHIGEFSAAPASPLPAVIPPGGTFTVNVIFTPANVGLRAARLNATVMGFAVPATTLLSGSGI